MTRDEFRRRFLHALEDAARFADYKLQHRVPRTFRVSLVAPGSPRGEVPLEEAVDALYLGEDRFFKVIDIGISMVREAECVAFVIPSGPPCPYEET